MAGGRKFWGTEIQKENRWKIGLTKRIGSICQYLIILTHCVTTKNIIMEKGQQNDMGSKVTIIN